VTCEILCEAANMDQLRAFSRWTRSSES